MCVCVFEYGEDSCERCRRRSKCSGACRIVLAGRCGWPGNAIWLFMRLQSCPLFKHACIALFMGAYAASPNSAAAATAGQLTTFGWTTSVRGFAT